MTKSKRQAAEDLIRANDSYNQLNSVGKVTRADKDRLAEATKEYDEAAKNEQGR